ncbi:hypothetical protein [Polaribacter sp.]|uniref:hypothetical protein n=1 Tax=Polaribacter sp. TaxID=1920175 RepID=UPI003EF82F5C
MIKNGICRLCGNNAKLTFEHIPPKGAFNSSPVYFQDAENLSDKSNYKYGGKKRSNKGAGGYHLCKSCNNNTGSWYANNYIDFVKLGAYVMTHRVYANNFICAEYTIKPLNVIKQILTMFIALESSGYLIKIAGLREFILNKHNQALPTNIKIFMYMTSSIKLRNALSWSNVDGVFRTFGEISYIPFGFHISIDSPPINRPFCDITSFSKQKFNEELIVKLPLRHLIPNKQFPGIYV